jgi:aprataxin
MPLVAVSRGAALEIPEGGDAAPTVLGRSLKRIGVVSETDVRNVSKAQIAVSIDTDAETNTQHLKVTAKGTNPTPYFEASANFEKKLLNEGESTLLHNGDGLGLCQTDKAPGPLRWQTDWNGITNTINDWDEMKHDGLASGVGGSGSKGDTKRLIGYTPNATVGLTKEAPSNKRPRTETSHAVAPSNDEEILILDESEIKKPIVLVCAGAPGSGKSTFGESLPRKHWVVVNQDTAGKNGKPGTRDQCILATKKALLLGKHVLIDRCGMTVEQRGHFLNLAIEKNATAHCLWLDLPKERLFQRLAHRTGHPTIKDGAGVAVCKRMLAAKAKKAPATQEGFEKVIRCRVDGDVEQARNVYSKLTRVRDCLRDGPGGEGGGTAVETVDLTDDGAPVTTTTPAVPTTNAFSAMMASAKTKPKSPEKVLQKKPFAFPGQNALSDVAVNPSKKEYADVVLHSDPELVVIKDKYPKAVVHLLVLARGLKFADGPLTLSATDVPLIRRMIEKGLTQFSSLEPTLKPKIGFHAVPSMKTLHLHVLSSDLRGSGMKTRRHWNSFATGFFKSANEACEVLESGNLESIKSFWDQEESERLVKMAPLKCHKCADGPFTNMPKLFQHVDGCTR